MHGFVCRSLLFLAAISLLLTLRFFDTLGCSAGTDDGGTPAASGCSKDGDCSSGNYCSSGSCVGLVSSGGSCTASTECRSGHCTNAFCTASESGCSSDSQCLVGEYCSTGSKCSALLANGAGCTASKECNSGNCSSGSCSAPSSLPGGDSSGGSTTLSFCTASSLSGSYALDSDGCCAGAGGPGDPRTITVSGTTVTDNSNCNASNYNAPLHTTDTCYYSETEAIGGTMGGCTNTFTQSGSRIVLSYNCGPCTISYHKD
ncbi:MAG: hypothetical protein HYS22_01760 [Deltaproteobacteria bacterium]|nr:hypothetical protein [Deltaproteobacteria bacterium]